MFYPSTLTNTPSQWSAVFTFQSFASFRISLRNVILGESWPVTSPFSCHVPLHPESWPPSPAHMWTSLHIHSSFTPLKTFILWPPLRAAAWAAQRKMEPGKRCIYILEAALRPFGNFKVSGIWRADNNWGGGFLMCQVGWAGCYFSEVPYLGVLWETWWVKGTAAIV